MPQDLHADGQAREDRMNAHIERPEATRATACAKQQIAGGARSGHEQLEQLCETPQ